MGEIAWSRDGSLRIATLGERQGHVVSAGSRWVWKVGDLSDITDDERVAVGQVELLLSKAAANDLPAPATETAAPTLAAPTPVREVPRQTVCGGPLWQASAVERWDVEAADYYAETLHASRSGLEVLRQSPRLFEAMRLTREIDDKESAALRRGRALHIKVFRPDLYQSLVRVVPSMRQSMALNELRSSLPPMGVLLTPDQAQQVAGMADAVRRHDLVGDWLRRESAQAEVAFRWRDEESGLPCKMMVDGYFMTAARDAVRAWDLKSTTAPSPSAFLRSVAQYGYHRQEAWYCDALQRHFGDLPVRFFFVAVRAEPPHEVAVHFLDDGFREAGRRQVRAGLRAWADYRARNDYRAPWEISKQPNRLTAPRWVLEEP